MVVIDPAHHEAGLVYPGCLEQQVLPLREMEQHPVASRGVVDLLGWFVVVTLRDR